MDIEKTLAGLRRERDKLDKAITALETLVPKETRPRPARTAAEPRLPGVPGSLMPAVLDALESEGKPANVKRIIAIMQNRGYAFKQADPRASVSQVLRKNLKGDKPTFVRITDGAYGLPKWYRDAEELMRAQVKAKQNGE